ncbi:hypothetical protein Bhyg_01269 [Pseudolycoriella hygida]|uniref:DUF1868 domain-containing protein n=1 Tax=Pseudolycoriella hygida TaxID=35572 RepID=A0A9Q0S7D3_9DIPT|nr:hypothetical protein Bhyg_01269 [Pseudolycoriella hygida]
MKTQIILCIFTCVVIVLFISKSRTHTDEDHHYLFVSYNPQKINRNGEYQPFYGYTIVAMIDPYLVSVADQIEHFLRRSSLAKSYSPLPANTYHMTIYSIYQCGNKIIPPVKRWLDATGKTISNRTWLPDEVLRKQNEMATCILQKYLQDPLRIEYASLNITERSVKLQLKADEDSMERIRKVRDELVKIYEDPDLSLEPINEKLHLGLAYVYAPAVNPDLEDWNQLNKLVRVFNGAKLHPPHVYLFDSMKNYMPFQSDEEIQCEMF